MREGTLRNKRNQETLTYESIIVIQHHHAPAEGARMMGVATEGRVRGRPSVEAVLEGVEVCRCERWHSSGT